MENLFGSFEEKERQEELEQFGKQITDPIMNLHTENYVFCSAIQVIYRIVLVYSVSKMF